MIALKIEKVALAALAGSLLYATPAVAESWVLWEMSKRPRTLTLHPSVEACTRAGETAARADLATLLQRYSDVQGRVVPGDPQRTGPGTWYVMAQSQAAGISEQVRAIFQCWPAGVTPR